MKQEIEIIVINWEKIEYGSLSLDEFKKEFDKYNNEWDCGLYQVYGNHYAYGRDSLLYIGETVDSTFKKRLLDKKRFEGDFLESTGEPQSVRIGRIVKNNDDAGKKIDEEKNWSEYIRIAENILIATHTPAFNSQLSNRLYQREEYKGENKEEYLIINLGDRGDLLPEVSTLRNSYRFYTYETPFGM